ncbi:MAG: hypothetical protein HY854_26225 [Burkholderiales bacterium]|nr:hypothetical protein [Burkholderiales bacterium]
MDTVIVYLDDADYARTQLAPDAAAPTHWVLVACAPRMTRRISKWVSHSARENWRGKWADRLFEQVGPLLQLAGHQVTLVLAKAPLPELTRELQAVHTGARVVDLRRPRGSQAGGWEVPGKLLGLGAAFAFMAD